jgi:glycosyltransferase involved in cell wall biosynthesis
MKYPKVSIVIPTYNRAHTLERSIRSVISQSFTDFELIIVDDGSPDGTREVICGFEDSRIRYIPNGFNGGPGSARNRGIASARGQYVAFQDSDDEWCPGKLQKQVDVMESADTRIGIVYTGFLRFEKNRVQYIPSRSISKREGDLYTQLFHGNFITSQTVLVRRECFDYCGMFDESLLALEDWDLWIRIARSYRFILIDEPLVHVYLSPDSLIADRYLVNISLDRLINKHFGDIKRYPGVCANLLRTSGSFKIVEMRQIEAGRQCLLESIRIRPDIRAIVGYLASFLGYRGYACAGSLWRLWTSLMKAVSLDRALAELVGFDLSNGSQEFISTVKAWEGQASRKRWVEARDFSYRLHP